ncbi:hypothetical protein [Streptosporangium roseum]|uniref:hypothetical protein n=1 Tax=Streptosporangium roseum TaxID=2001 RepID=UPI00332A7A01
MSKSTTSVLRFARRFSWAAISAGVVWELLAIPSDQALNRAMHGWEEIAYKARQIFGTDLAALRELAMADWSGVAKDAADDRIFRFVRGGIDLADFATNMANRLANLTEQLNALHTAAYWTACHSGCTRGACGAVVHSRRATNRGVSWITTDDDGSINSHTCTGRRGQSFFRPT